MTIKTFLEKLSVPKNKQILKLVTGNQSADMDSVVSAIAYAYFHHQKYPKEEPILPLVNISRDEFRLRKDIVLLLSRHDISSSNVYFLDDVEKFTEQSVETLLDVVLVDHCNLQGELLTNLYDQKRLIVSGIVDHHADEGVFLDAVPRIIRSTGSCSALVFNYWNSQIGPILDRDVVLLLLGPLLIDTLNMLQKVEADDIEAFTEYQKVLSDSATIETVSTSPFSSFFAELKEAKKDLKGFLLFDILRKDYKQFKFKSAQGEIVSVGFSSIGKSLSWVLRKYPVSEILLSLKQMSETFHLDVVIITSSFTQKESRIYIREFCFSTHNNNLQDLASLAEELQLNTKFHDQDSVAEALAQINNSVLFKVYNQQNTAASRKQVVPVIKQVIEQRL
ncbi:exopolyphosphatase [Metschnikowia aff. pulcherrima]|uniref:Exopolyphosphatase n=1 Tax=Metschnikowia aff. pulcherrima TaxID=2163413 RepID=A0A4V1AEI5_9ASCO|nr:exopolyphosphatase [Metschnikowia aff. pulcherrima]